ncbi:DUF732 domain-containing protein [Mycobacterium sp. ITM-2016-00316]|uniref:DUF732 domain-containing protein n=1 Tax=Mycobacterium sp. ITM-2016-00316 TaxID=2099695 RepID=UPI001304A070
MTIRRLLPAAVAVVAALLHSPPAYADDAGFLARLEKVGIENEGGEAALLDVGREICRDLFNGEAGEDLAAELFYTSAYGQDDEPRYALSLTLARWFVVYAITELCPGAGALPGALPD